MRIKALFLLASCFTLMMLSGCDSAGGNDSGDEKKTFSDAVSFNDYLVERQDTVFEPLMEFVENDKYFKDTAVGYAQLDKIVAASDRALEDLNNVEPYKEGEAFLKAAKAQAEFYKGIAEKDYREVVQLLAKGEDITEEELARAQSLEDNIFERAGTIDDAFLNRQKEFARKVNMTLEDKAPEQAQ